MENSSKDQPDAPEEQAREEQERKGISGLQVLQSTFAAALGVQSRKNRERDFQDGKASQFIIAGILFTLIFIGVMIAIVRTVLGGT